MKISRRNALARMGALAENYNRVLPMVAEAGFRKIICFSGNRNGLDDETGLQHCEQGIKQLMSTAEQHGVTVCQEPLNSRRVHPGYFCDNTRLGAKLCSGEAGHGK